jgi:hypothetical protein
MMSVFLMQAMRELAMVIPIDAVRGGAGFDGVGRWHKGLAIYQLNQAAEVETMCPARGAAWGLLASAVLWLGVVGAARALFTLLR